MPLNEPPLGWGKTNLTEYFEVSEWRTPPLSGQGSAERNGDRRRMSASERAVGSASKSWRRYQ